MKYIVYGAGIRGKMLINYLAMQKNIIVDAIFVSKGHVEECEYRFKLNQQEISIPIMESTDEKINKESTEIFMTVVKEKEKVSSELKKMGYKNIIDLDLDFINFENEFWDSYFKLKKIDLESEILNFGNVKVYNPLKIDNVYRKILVDTMVDELCPGALDDFSLIVEGAYELDEVCLKKGDVVIDVGANIGLYSCYAAQKGCKVYACEPSTNALKILHKQKEIYNDKIEILEIGLADKEGSSMFYESDSCVLDSMVMAKGNYTERMIKTETLDNLVSSGKISRVDYIKADIEGAERMMLRGAINTLKVFSPKISICTYHLEDDARVLEHIIKEANPKYIVKHKWKKLYAYVPK